MTRVLTRGGPVPIRASQVSPIQQLSFSNKHVPGPGQEDILVSYCRAASVSSAPCKPRRMCCPTHCASYCAPWQRGYRMGGLRAGGSGHHWGYCPRVSCESTCAGQRRGVPLQAHLQAPSPEASASGHEPCQVRALVCASLGTLPARFLQAR